MRKLHLLVTKRRLATLAKITLLVFSLIAIKRFCKNATEGFTIANISRELSYKKTTAPSLPTEEEKQLIKEITAQKFSYLAKGAQVYAFISEDQKYIIKFFKKNTISVPKIIELLPLEFFENKKKVKQEKLLTEFASYEIAYEDLKDETGLLYIHLQPTNHISSILTIKDRLNIEHKIDLDKIEFLVQKKADLIYPTLDRLMKEEKQEDAKTLISSIFNLLATRASKGYIDTDQNISKNFACIGMQVIQIDIGRFYKCQEGETVSLQHLERMRQDFRGWIEINHPSLLSHFDEEFFMLLQKGSF